MKYNYPKVSPLAILFYLAIPILIFLITIGIDLMQTHNYRTDGPWIPVKSGAKIFSYMGNDTIATNLAKGDSVKVIGILDNSKNGRLLVETTNGYRGALYYWWADIDFITSNPEALGDTLRLNPPVKMVSSNYGLRYGEPHPKGILIKNGQPIDIDRYHYYPAIKNFEKYDLQERHNYSKIMSEDKMKRLTTNLKRSEAEKAMGPMKYIAKTKTGDTDIRFRTFVFNPEDGKFYYPIVTFGADSIAVSTSMEMASDRGSWALKYLPLASFIYDMPITTFMTRTGVYDQALLGPDFTIKGFKNVLDWIGRLFAALLGLIWIFAFGAIPMGIIYCILHYPRILFALSDKAVTALMAILAVIFTYYWIIALMGWGAYWWVAALMIAASFQLWNLYVEILSDEIPHVRCQECRAMNSMKLINKEFLHSEHTKETRTESTKIGQSTTKTKEWTDVYRGNTKIREENHHTTVDTDTTYRDREYDEQVRYDNYKLHYRCSVCGRKEYSNTRRRHVLGSRYKGTSTRTEHKTEEFDY